MVAVESKALRLIELKVGWEDGTYVDKRVLFVENENAVETVNEKPGPTEYFEGLGLNTSMNSSSDDYEA